MAMSRRKDRGRTPGLWIATATDGHTVVIDEVVADKGYHSNPVRVDLRALDLRTYIAEPARGRMSCPPRAVTRFTNV